jgi:hypothetical protein
VYTKWIFRVHKLCTALNRLAEAAERDDARARSLTRVRMHERTSDGMRGGAMAHAMRGRSKLIFLSGNFGTTSRGPWVNENARGDGSDCGHTQMTPSSY